MVLEVMIIGDTDSYIATIDENGRYFYEGLIPGMYVVSVVGQDSENYVVNDDVEIIEGRSTIIDFKSQLKSVVLFARNRMLNSISEDPYAVEIKWWQTTRGVAKEFYDDYSEDNF